MHPEYLQHDNHRLQGATTTHRIAHTQQLTTYVMDLKVSPDGCRAMCKVHSVWVLPV